VELAGGLSELFGKVLVRDFPRLDVTRARIVLVEPTARLLGTFHPRLSEHAARALRARGVEVELGVGVAKATATEVALSDGRVIPTCSLVWTAGVRANPLADVLGVEQTRAGRIVVEPDLSLPGHPEVFVVGDLAASPAPGTGDPLGQVAPVAIQGGTHVAHQIRARLEGRPTAPFHYRDKGSMATIGRNDAVADLPAGIHLTGPLGWLAWLGLHLVMLIGFRNRANVLVNWAWNYITYDRGARLIVGGP
jgi:NADH dehydrogenase